MYDTLLEMQEQGYNVDKLTPTHNNNDIVWDSVNNQFVLVMENGEYYTGTSIDDYSGVEKSTLWKVYTSVPSSSEYSIYLAGTSVSGTANVNGVGFDAGENSGITKINYTNSGSAKEVTIRTNGGELVVNAENDTVSHYGKVEKVVVEKVASHSYYENGSVSISLEAKNGHIVVNSGATVNELVVGSTSTNADVSVSGNVNTIIVENTSAKVNVSSSANVDSVVAPSDNSNITLPSNVSKVEKTEVSTAEDLINAVNNTNVKYIVLKNNIDVDSKITINRNLTIDGTEKKYSVSATSKNTDRIFDIGGNSNESSIANVVVTFKNLKIVGPTSGSYTRGINIYGNYATIYVLNSEVSCNYYAINLCTAAHHLTLKVDGSKVSGYAALNIWSYNNDIEVTNSELSSVNSYNGGDNEFATIVFEANDSEFGVLNNVKVVNSKLSAVANGTAEQTIVGFNSNGNGATNCSIEFVDCELNGSLYYQGGQGNKLVINGEVKFSN